jgi:hypothetical protein
MTTTISIEQHIDELRAELGATTCDREAAHIVQELVLSELYAGTPDGRRAWARNPNVACRV